MIKKENSNHLEDSKTIGHTGNTENTKMLQEQYRIRFSKSDHYRNCVWQILCDGFFSQFIAAEAHILDIGCGWGEFINNIRASKRFAMDLNADSKLRLSKEVYFLHQDCSQPWPLESESLDVVFTSNFLEHLPSKNHIEKTLQEAYRCLKLEGLIICLGPNIKYVAGAYWDFWDHFVPITERSIAEVLQLQGFYVQKIIPRFLPYSMSTGSNPPLFLVSLYLKLPMMWPWFGKQFLVVGKKL